MGGISLDNKEISRQLIDVRTEYIKLIKSELLGPGSEFALPDAEHELISSSPISRYSVGILYPQGNYINQDSDETVPINEIEITTESENEEIPLSVEPIPKPFAISPRNYELDETANENLDEEIGLSAQYMSSSMGITFIVKGNADLVRGNVSFATYKNAKVPDCIIPFIPDNPESYSVPSALEHKMQYDKEMSVMRLFQQ